MIINMLEAVSEMLKDSKEIRVNCAKIMLDKVIGGMKDEPVMMGHGRTPEEAQANMHPVTPEVTPVTKPKREAQPGEVEIMVDAGKIKSIKNATDDTMIQLDGRAYSWKDAIGRSFTEGKVL